MIDSETRRVLEARFYPDLEERVFGLFARRLAHCLPEGALVLDAGSGSGSWVLQEHRQRIGFLVGVDLSAPREPRLDGFVLGSCEALPFASASFDLVLAYLVIEHLPDPLRAFAEFARVLRPGGYFCFKTPAVHTPLFLLARLLPVSLHKRLKARIGTAEEDVFPTFYRANTPAALERGLSQAGFRREWLYTVDQTYAYLTQSPWTYTLGLLYSRLTNLAPLAWLRNQIIGIYRLPAEGEE